MIRTTTVQLAACYANLESPDVRKRLIKAAREVLGDCTIVAIVGPNVTEADVVEAGLTWEHVDTWVLAQPDGSGEEATDGRPLWSWRKKRDNPDGPTWQYGTGTLIHRGLSLVDAVRCAARVSNRPERDVLGEMAAVSKGSA